METVPLLSGEVREILSTNIHYFTAGRWNNKDGAAITNGQRPRRTLPFNASKRISVYITV